MIKITKHEWISMDSENKIEHKYISKDEVILLEMRG